MKKQRVLVVEDSAVTLRSLRNYLAALCPDIEISCGRNGREAIDRVKQQHPDLVIMDMVMPHLDGARATQEIKANWPEVKIILLLLDPKQGQLALESGADAYLLKGSDVNELSTVIGEMGITVKNNH